MKSALMFSGQGAQKVGMGKDLYENSPLARSLYDQADEIVGWKLSETSFNGPQDRLTETKMCQSALFVHGYVVHALLQEKGALGEPVVALGLSLGEVTALTVAGVFDFETGLRVVAERGRLMQEACEATNGSMAAVLGVERAVVSEFCDDMGVQMANLNCPGQIVISGEKERIVAAVEAGKERGFRRVVELDVAGAYHSRLMEPAGACFAAFLEGVIFKEPQLKVLTNTTGQPIEDPEAIRKALVDQVVSTVFWEDCMTTAATLGVDRFFELGMGGVLKGHLKRTNKDLVCASFETWADVEGA